MGIFSHFKEQEQRLDALEAHVRAMTEVVQQNQLDIASGLVALLALQSQIDTKVDVAEVDPAVAVMNAEIGVAREEYLQAAAAAEDRWVELQAGVQSKLTELRAKAEEARKKILDAVEEA